MPTLKKPIRIKRSRQKRGKICLVITEANQK
jgi:hypothetical protein